MKGKISSLHVILLSMTVIGLKNHVTIIPSIIQEAGRDGWLAVIVAAVGIVPWLFMIVYVLQAVKGQPMRQWLLEQLGKKMGYIVIYAIGVYCLLLAAFTMRETLEWVKTTFLASTPLVLLLFIYVLLVILLVTTNLQTIAMLNVIVLFVVVVLGFFIAFVNIPVKDYTLLLPVLEHGFSPVLIASLYPASGFIELFPFLLIQHQVKAQMKMRHLALMLFLLTGLTMGPLLGAITEFGHVEAAKQMYPAYEEWGLAQVGDYIEHMDFFSIYQWMSGTFIRAGFIIFVGVQLLGLEGKQQAIWRFVAPALFFSSLSLFLINDAFFILIKGHYFLVVTLLFFIAISFLFTWTAFRSKGKKKIDKRGEDQ